LIYLIKKGLIILREEGLTVFIKKSSSYIFREFIELTGLEHILAPLIIRKFRRAVYNVNGINDSVNFAFSFKYLGVSIKPSQVIYEITRLLELVERLKPKTVLEIGTAGGGTLFLFTRVADPKATIISIDLPGGPFGGGYPRWKIPLYKSFSKEGQKIYLIRRNSHDPQTLREVKGILGDEKVDFLFIDGDHTYDGVKMDFEIYSPLVKRDGIIAFHDIVPGPPEAVGGVPRFWAEIKHKYRCVELVNDWSQNGYGIGVIFTQ
jgi:predicted O-methyltransferase YrrM